VVTPDQPWLAWGVTAAILIALIVGVWIGVRHFRAWRAAKHAVPLSAVAAADSSPSHDAPAYAVAGSPTNATDAAADAAAPAAAPITAADAAASAAPVTAVADRFELKVEAAKKTRITVTADKAVVYKGTIKAGENQVFSAADNFQVSAKDAGALRLELNGKAIRPIGPSGHSGKVTLTRDSLKDAPGGGN
jgi:cytoskeletal protein RodZ